MSLATVETREQGFLSRFERLRSSLRRYQVLEGLAWSALVATVGLATMAAIDFLRELSLPARAAGLGAVGVTAMVVLLTRVVLPLRWWTKPRTAAEIEGRFPQLGQRIRTVVQYAGRTPGEIDAEGVTPSLVEALEGETEARADPLPLDRVVPWWRARALGVTAGVAVVAMMAAAAISPEWRIAIGRALLGRTPYTTLEVAPKDIRVDQGADVAIVAELAGRSPSDVVLYTRPEGQADAPWRVTDMKKPDDSPESRRVARLEKVDTPMAYRIVAGSATSPTYRIDIRYPLTMMTFDVDLRPPAYTGADPSTVKGGDLRVVERTEATFRVAFDATPASASLVLTDSSRPSRKDKKPPEPRVIPLKPEGNTYMAGLVLDKGLSYRIQATTPDGRALPESRYKIEVIEDRAPRVAFEEPAEALEVHPIAEVKNRIRVADDFGLTRAGLVIQFGEGDEQTLVLKDFAPEAGKPRTSGALEEMLLLEKLAASPRSSVTYYAFAEDNNPNGPARTETELRYIDIRPFKREYKMAEPGDPIDGVPLELASLAELIARQRFNLNRATRLAKHKPGDRTAVEDPLKIAGFEENLVELTRGFTEGIEGIVGQRIEPLHQAEESMLAAVSALDHGQIAPAPRHMADAVRHLIEARDTVRIIIGDQSPEAQRSMRSFDRLQAQKIRKPKKDQEEAEEIAEDIEQLGQDEDFVYATLNGLKMDPPDRPAETKAKAEGDGASGDAGESKPEEAEKKDPRREAVDRQEKVADRARELEEALKKLELASDLARARMARAADAAEKASVDLARGSTKEATETAKDGASMLHELARQLKGELADDVAEELAMARDLADELARREAELARIPSPGQGSQPGEGEGDQEGKGKGPKKGQGQGRGEAGGAGGDLADADRLRGLEEAARTLEQWLKDASLRAEGPSADRTKEALTEGDATRIVERMERIAELGRGGKDGDARREAVELSRRLEMLSRVLDVLHRDIVAPELAKLVEFDRRIAELTAQLRILKTDAEIADWHRLATELIRDMEKAGLDETAAVLVEVIREEGRRRGIGRWNWGVGDGGARIVPVAYPEALVKVTSRIQQRIQDMILKDMASARDEATPPQFKELVERYYEVLSKDGAR